MIKAFEPAPSKHFKTPKYTGVFLSLLSMFVLASMFVVWEQIPKENEGPLLQVKVISTLKQCMEGISPSFEKEMGVSVHFTYSADDKIVEEILSPDEEGSPFDLYIFQEPDNLTNSSLRDQCVERIPLVFIPPEHPANSTDGSILVSANLSNRTQNPTLALQFARYLAAPSRGQFGFSKNGFGGVNGDLWSEIPTLKIFMNQEHASKVTSQLKAFEVREGVTLETSTLPFEKMDSALQIILQSEAQEFLPDLVFLNQKASWPPSFPYVLVNANDPEHSPALIYQAKGNAFPNLSKRLIRFLTHNKKAA